MSYCKYEPLDALQYSTVDFYLSSNLRSMSAERTSGESDDHDATDQIILHCRKQSQFTIGFAQSQRQGREFQNAYAVGKSLHALRSFTNSFLLMFGVRLTIRGVCDLSKA